MSETVSMPALGESVTEGTVTMWLKQVGEVVALDEPLLEVSTDKVDTEIPSPVAGVLLEILVAEDETVDVGTPLAVVGSALELEAESPVAPLVAPEVPNPEIPSTVTMAADGTAQVEWSYPSVPPVPPKAEAIAPAPPPVPAPEVPSELPVTSEPSTPATAPVPPVSPEIPPVAPAPPVPSTPETSKRTDSQGDYVTPIVRKLAAEKGVDLSQIKGTGVGGRIRKQDVLDAAGIFPQSSARTTPPSLPPTPPIPSPPVLPTAPAIPPAPHEPAVPPSMTPPVSPVSPAPAINAPATAPRTASGELDVARLAELFAEVAQAFGQNTTVATPKSSAEATPTATQTATPVPPPIPSTPPMPSAPPVPPLPPAVATTPPVVPAPPTPPVVPPPTSPAMPVAPATPVAPEPPIAALAPEPPVPSDGEKPIVMPALGESVTEGTVTTWLKQVGDAVAVDEPLLEVSTDKVDTEVPSPISGVITRILVQEDETVEVGTVLAYVQ